MHSVCPLDSKYKHIVKPVTRYFSDFHFTQTAYQIEVDYYFALMKFLGHDDSIFDKANDYFNGHTTLTDVDYNLVKEIEKKNNHHIKAIEVYFRNNLNRYLDEKNSKFVEFSHFGLTSQDVVSLTMVSSIKAAMKVVNEKFCSLIELLDQIAVDNKYSIIVGRTHGQPALPTTICYQFARQKTRLTNPENFDCYEYFCKFSGAIGELNAFNFFYPDKKWDSFLDVFTSKYGVRRALAPTQTDNYDSVCNLFDLLKRNCTILENLAVDVWDYVSRDYFKLEVSKDYVGSSVMGQKINPINFENAEGNFQIAANQFEFYANSLRKSRLQRDLSDSTKIRNIGIPLAHFYLAIDSLEKGLKQLKFDANVSNAELDGSYAMLAEPLQLGLRICGVPDAYNKVKNYFIGNKLDRSDYQRVINDLIAEYGGDKETSAMLDKLYKLTLEDYTKIWNIQSQNKF